MDTRIYMMTHKAFEVPKMEGYIPLQVGSALGNDLGYLKDNTGDHISEKNPSYCELTGLYWFWKNVKCDVVGLCHYRRCFTCIERAENAQWVEEVLLPVSYIEECMQKYDLIIPNSGMTLEGSVLKHYQEHHCISDWEECGRVIQEKYPQYYPAFLWNQDINLISLGNMVIGKKSLIDEYCEWLFDILFELETRISIEGRDTYQKRVFGFLSERLFRVWIFGKRLKIKEELVVMLE